MDLIQQLGTALGLGLLSGVRLYMTILALGAALRLHWITLDPSQNGLAILGDWRVMTIAGIACAVEFVADKIPWVDSLWNSIHTFIRPVGAVVLGARAFMHMDPAIQAILAILCGGLALSSHSVKSAARLAVNQSPEPFSNIALSLAGDAAVPIATWTAFHFPILTLGFVVAFMLLFAWLGPKIYRAVRLQTAALGAAFGRWFGGPDLGAAPVFATSLPAEFLESMRPLPENVLAKIRKQSGEPESGSGVRCAATKSSPGLNRAIGYLAVTSSELVFVTRGLLGNRSWSIRLSDIQSSSWTSGILLDCLTLATTNGQIRLDVLKAAPRQAAAVAVGASAS